MDFNRDRNNHAVVALILGIMGIILWAIPIIGIFVNIICIYTAAVGINTRLREISVAGLVLGIIGVILTILRSGLVFFLT